MANDVKVLKLTTGEELISRMEESRDGFLILEKPMSSNDGTKLLLGKWESD